MSDLFRQYPNMSEYFETSDGEKFFKEYQAQNHARTLENKKVKTVSKHDIDVSNSATEPKGETAKDIVAKTATMDLATAQDYLQKEEDLEQPRKTVVDALQKRISELQNLVK